MLLFVVLCYGMLFLAVDALLRSPLLCCDVLCSADFVWRQFVVTMMQLLTAVFACVPGPGLLHSQAECIAALLHV